MRISVPNSRTVSLEIFLTKLLLPRKMEDKIMINLKRLLITLISLLKGLKIEYRGQSEEKMATIFQVNGLRNPDCSHMTTRSLFILIPWEARIPLTICQKMPGEICIVRPIGGRSWRQYLRKNLIISWSHNKSA